MTSLVIESDWIVPVESPAIRGGFIVVDTGRILHVGDQLPARFASLPKLRLSGGAILPGLINSHCHLELSDILTPLEVPDLGDSPSMVGWLNKLMSRRRALIDSGSDIEQIKRAAIDVGIRSAWESGTRLVVDNITAPWNAAWCNDSASGLTHSLQSEACRAITPDSPIYIWPCIELVDVTQIRSDQTWGFYQQSIASMTDTQSACLSTLGLAPHAPYTASKQIVQRAAKSAMESRSLLCMHLAESLEELEYVNQRKGPFSDWISPWIDSNHAEHIGTIDEHLQLVADSHRALIAHGNYLDEMQIETLHANRDKIAVVYCPRTHRHFRHSDHPANRLATKGIPVFLGTDSRASNPDLSIFEEWKHACRTFPELGPRFWMASCTTNPANFLSTNGLVGTLRVGSKSLLTWLPLVPTDIENEDHLWQAMQLSQQAMPLEVRIASI